jgi:hypothetical protein
MTELNADPVLAALEARFLAIQKDAVLVVDLKPNDPNRPKLTKVNSDTNKLITDADNSAYGDLSVLVGKFQFAFNNAVAQQDLKALKAQIKDSWKDLSSLKAAAEIVKKDVKDLALPNLNKQLGDLEKALGSVNNVFKTLIGLGLGDDDDKKHQQDLEAALKKLDDALKKIADDEKKKKDDAAKADKKGG